MKKILNDPTRIRRPLEVDIDVDDNIYLVWCEELTSWGSGTTEKEAIEDFYTTILDEALMWKDDLRRGVKMTDGVREQAKRMLDVVVID